MTLFSLKRNVALKIDIAGTSSTDRELQALQICSHAPQEPGAEVVPKLLDSFKHEGPNGLHQCYVLGILGPSIPNVLERRFKDCRLPKKIVSKVVGESLLGLAFLHKLRLGHGGKRYDVRLQLEWRS